MKRSVLVILGLMVGFAVLVKVTDRAFRADRVAGVETGEPASIGVRDDTAAADQSMPFSVAALSELGEGLVPFSWQPYPSALDAYKSEEERFAAMLTYVDEMRRRLAEERAVTRPYSADRWALGGRAVPSSETTAPMVMAG